MKSIVAASLIAGALALDSSSQCSDIYTICNLLLGQVVGADLMEADLTWVQLTLCWKRSMVIQESSLGQVKEDSAHTSLKTSGNAITLRTLGKAPGSYLKQDGTRQDRTGAYTPSLRDLILELLTAMRWSFVRTRTHSDLPAACGTCPPTSSSCKGSLAPASL